MKCINQHLLFLLSAALLFMFVFGAPTDVRVIDDAFRTGASNESSENTTDWAFAITPTPEPAVPKTCHSSTPCGWAIYNPFNRQIDYYIKGHCKCSPDTECLRVDDDVTIAAYVYRCTVDSPDLKDPAVP